MHGRRLIDNAASIEQFAETVLKVASGKAVLEMPVRTILNTIIHHQYLDICRFKYELMADPWAVMREENHGHFPPLVTVRSNQGRSITFGLWELVKMFETEVLVPTVDTCADNKLYLDDLQS